MITRDIATFLSIAGNCAADFGPATAKAAFLVAPDGFTRAEESARDNAYMAEACHFDAIGAMVEHRALHQSLARALPTICFAGDPSAPDGLFPNNVFATVPGQLIVGRMRHPVRQREAGRSDIRQVFRDLLGYRETDLSLQPHPCELTGALIIDRARGIGFCGLSERCDEAGAALMHHAFGLRATLMFDLAPGEYHANVVLAVLAGRVALVCPQGFADPAVVDAVISVYGQHAIVLTAGEHRAFAANAISLLFDRVWMSGAASRALSSGARGRLHAAGFAIEAVDMPAIEAAGGSLRCCVAEIF